DPYRYQKARFLTVTSELRIRLALDRQRELLRSALADLPTRLQAIWTSPSLAPSERRRLIRLLAEECARDPDGAAARALIEAFMREHPAPPQARPTSPPPP